MYSEQFNHIECFERNYQNQYICRKQGSLEKKLILITGPTASGKSKLAIDLALELKCPIVSADSRQLYRGLDIGTAKPDKKERALVPHWIIDILEPGEKYSAAQFERDAESALSSIFKGGDYAILCGGTGFYLKALLHGLDQLPDVPEEIYESLYREMKTCGLEPLADELKESDPNRAGEINLQNPRRVIRSLAIVRHTGRMFGSFKRKEPKKLPWKVVKILLLPDRKLLYERINRRVDKMVSAGLEEEAKELHAMGVLHTLETVGYSEWIPYFEGMAEREEVIELIKRNTRRYAKRQYTWFRRQEGYAVLDPEEVGLLQKLKRILKEDS